MSLRGSSTERRHILTVNLEDYFQVGHLSGVIPQKYWDRFEKRVEQSTLATLDLLDKHNAKATFFTVGWLADQARDIVAEVSRRGHEIASKGYLHRSIGQMSPKEFRRDAVRSRVALERACCQEVLGYRIARGWYTKADLWALDILAEEGFVYDSSVRPFGRIKELSRQDQVLHSHSTKGGEIWILPISSWWSCGFSLPISGGNYMRQLPHRLIRNRVEAWHRSIGSPLILYFHVWELDPAQPRVSAAPWLDQMRHYRNLDGMRARVDYYLSRYRMVSACDFLGLPREPVSVQPDHTEATAPPISFSTDRKDVTVVVPCFNEVSSIPFLKRSIEVFETQYRHKYNIHLIFVDDGSSDDTLEHLSSTFGAWNKCDIIRHDRNRGVAAATLTGVRNARTDVVCVIDCDCSYDIGHLARLIPLLGSDVDLVTASPYHKEGNVLNVPRWRITLSRGASVLYRIVLSTKLATYTACFRVYRRSAIVDLEISNGGFLGITEILALLDQRGSRIVECATVLEPRLFGQSKMKVVLAIIGHLRLLAKIGLRRGLARENRSGPRKPVPLRRDPPSAWWFGGTRPGRMVPGGTKGCEWRAREGTNGWQR